jgi:uncharacterized Zn-finger protein
MTQAATQTAAGKRPAPEPIAVTRADLPLSCPRPTDALWNMHPRVYLPIEDEPDHRATCPYCGAVYVLKD